MAKPIEVSLLGETRFQHKVEQGSLVTCPTLDLSASWSRDGSDLFILRPPGQVVSKIHQVPTPGRKAPKPLTVSWRPDGQFLAVGWTDGVVRLMSLEHSKAAHHIHVNDGGENRISHIGWTSSIIADRGRPSSSNRVKASLGDDVNFLGRNAGVDLPRDLTFLEVDTALPKISPLPSGSAGAGEDAMVFTLRTGIEFLFQTPKPEDYDLINVMIVGTFDGLLHLSIYDSFTVATFENPLTGLGTPSHMIRFASSSAVSTQLLVMADTATEPELIYLVPMDLPFISSSPINLSFLAYKLTTLQKLLRYLNQTQLHMQVEWKNTRELPTRFLRSVQIDLEEMQTGPRDIASALYHTVVTGHAHAPVREWLVDSLAERGHKRWDKAVVAGLEGLRSLVHENFLPALERCSIILSRLRGLAQFYDTRDDIGFSVPQISRVMDIIGALTFVGHKILVLVMDELEHFASFSTWLRFQIDRLASSSTSTEELTEKEATMDNGRVLTYIDRFLVHSPLDIFFDESAKQDAHADGSQIGDGSNLLDMIDKQLKLGEHGQPYMKALPQVDFLVKYMTSRSEKIFRDIAEAKKRSVRFGQPIKISVGSPITRMDVRCGVNGDQGGVFYTALASKQHDGQVFLFRASVDITNGISTNQPLTACRFHFTDRHVVDLKFLDDETLLVLLLQRDNVPVVARVAISSMPFGPYVSESPDDMILAPTDGLIEYSFSMDQVLRPVQMEVHDSTDVRGHLPARLCLLNGDRTTLKTFEIPRHTNTD